MWNHLDIEGGVAQSLFKQVRSYGVYTCSSIPSQRSCNLLYLYIEFTLQMANNLSMVLLFHVVAKCKKTNFQL